MDVFTSFLFSWSFPTLNSLPSMPSLTLTLTSQSLKAFVSMAEYMRLNSVGARTKPCLTPVLALNGSEVLSLS
ncbi:hypothetical protein DPMN_119086 [Dreissena polymorpha]|uniref:Uncharacterized protein n=1 Tax=Dreissena polymorpha TaxID=45954 RepID=A0A9D4JQX4_DREPO|nr:hypothetical protein DPMN_119086 [Dreissena polymorpha]